MRAAPARCSRTDAGDDYTCIDCHKGIAHQLPDMTGIEPGWLPPEEVREELGLQSELDTIQKQVVDYLQTAEQSQPPPAAAP